MKKRIAGLVLCVLMLCCLYGCAQNEPTATQPTELLNETVPTTEATEPRELTEEGKTQLKYEQMFADGTYVMNWDCVIIDVNTDYYVELFSDENGIFWESLRSMAEDPHYIYSYYFYRRNENTAYCFTNFLEDKDGDYDTSDFYYVDVNSANNGNIVNSTVEEMQNLFANFLSRKKELTYEVAEDGTVIVTIDCGSLDSLIVHIDPNTSEVRKLYIVNYDKTYCVEFVSKTVDDVFLKVDDLPFKITETITFTDIQNHREEMAIEIASHMCERSEWAPSAPFETKEQTDEEMQQKQQEWAKIVAEETYILNWDSVKVNMGSSYHVEVLSDENGIYWEAIATLEGDSHQYYANFYRTENNTAYYITYTPQDGTNCLLVDMSNRNDGTYAYSKVIGVQWLFDNILSRQKEVEYKGIMDGAAVVKINCGPIESLTFHIDPATCEVRKLYIVDSSSTEVENAYYVEFVPNTAAKQTITIPSTTNGTITLNDVFIYAGEVSSEIATHDCQKHWLPIEEIQRGINGPDGEE